MQNINCLAIIFSHLDDIKDMIAFVGISKSVRLHLAPVFIPKIGAKWRLTNNNTQSLDGVFYSIMEYKALQIKNRIIAHKNVIKHLAGKKHNYRLIALQYSNKYTDVLDLNNEQYHVVEDIIDKNDVWNRLTRKLKKINNGSSY